MKKNQYAELPPRLLPWYKANARDLPWRRDRHPYHVWVSEIMLQQTRAEAVCSYYNRFLSALPTVQDLAEADTQVLLKLWEGLGYYNRARNLQKAAQIIVNEYAGIFPNSYEGWLRLPGIGPYTAGAIASISFDLPVAAVDGNVLRVVTRVTENALPIDLSQTKTEVKAELERIYPAQAGMFTQALMELGAMVCTPKSPKCAICPLTEICLARQHDTAAAFPVKLPKRAKKAEEKTVFFLTCGSKIALTKRGDSGLLAGLWQLPNVSGRLSEEAAVQTVSAWGVQPQDLTRTVHKTHIFTHIRWDMYCYYFSCAESSGAMTWVKESEIQGRYALPTAFRQFFD